jgi:ABC-type transport system involved in multi-copper enzyme maturation permease subunit
MSESSELPITADSEGLPPRQTSVGNSLATLYTMQLRQLLTARKTIALTVVALLPVIAALLFVVLDDVDGLSMFNGIVESVLFPFLLPLFAIFYGGPVIVDEMEGRTLTYLTLRPLPRPVIYTSKFLAGTTLGLLLAIVPLLILFAVCLGGSGDMNAMFESLGKLTLASAIGVITYTSIFTMLGALFSSNLLAGIIYFVVFEIVMAFLPVLELLSVRFYLRDIAGLRATDRLGVLDKLVYDEPVDPPMWASILLLLVLIGGAVALGNLIFRNRQYNV